MSQSGRGYFMAHRSGDWRTSQANRSRGGWGGRSPTNGRWNNRSAPPQEEPTYPPQPLGRLLLSISKADCEEVQDSNVATRTTTENQGSSSANWKTTFQSQYCKNDVEKIITGTRYVASYSWLTGLLPTVLMPGKPPAWAPLKEAQQLKEDTGVFFRDPNAARYPEYTMRPAVEAVLKNSSLPPADVRVFACGSTMGNLLRFVRGIDKSFRFDVEMVGETVFFVRKEKHPKEVIPGVRGYGHTFPEAYTTWDVDVRGSESHQRMISYDFGGIKCLIRFESDGYLRNLVPADELTSAAALSALLDDDDFALAFGSTTLNPSQTSPGISNAAAAGSNLTIKSGGQPIPQAAVFDLKTRSARGEIDMSEIYPRLWISQIPNFIIAYHNRGVFDAKDIHVQDVRDGVTRWERENQDAVKRLHMLLSYIIEYASLHRFETQKLEIIRSEMGVLEIREQDGESRDVLPPDLRRGWLSPRQENESDDERSNRGTRFGGRALIDSDDERFNNSDDDRDKDYTACSAEDCGYCGRCPY